MVSRAVVNDLTRLYEIKQNCVDGQRRAVKQLLWNAWFVYFFAGIMMLSGVLGLPWEALHWWGYAALLAFNSLFCGLWIHAHTAWKKLENDTISTIKKVEARHNVWWSQECIPAEGTGDSGDPGEGELGSSDDQGQSV